MKQAFYVAAALAAMGAQAHVTIEMPTATAGAYAKVVLQVPHGCNGSATKSVTVDVPQGLLFAKARAKPGWTITYEKAALTPPVDLHGRRMTETTASIRWDGGLLPNDQFDEFALMGKLADGAAGDLPFRVRQVCEKGEADWKGGPKDEEPAPVLKVTPRGAATPHEHH